MWNAILPTLLFTFCVAMSIDVATAEQLSAADMDKVMPVLLPGLPCDVRDWDQIPSQWRDAYPCVNEESTSEDSSERTKRHSEWYRKKRTCPILDQSQVTKGLSTDSADYPVTAIAQCLISGIVVGRTANTLDTLLATAVVPGRAPFVNTASLLAEVCRNCPTDRNQLFKYTSPTTGTTCWVIQNLNAPISVNLRCNDRLLCSKSWWAIYYNYQNRCYPEFQTFQVQGYCPRPAGPCLVTDTLLLPVRCTCRTVRCH